ncbi:hypothetical protein B0H34DRAFT_712680 [Crassisporium funariophilum]|nr:hypothetical protein B0H34DRAFT_712680 [Crassisporium funariophilum]
MNGCPEPLEKIFQQVEEESERRAQEERPSSTAAKRHKDRRRGSISISRIGQLTEELDATSKSQVPNTPNRLTMASHSPFYQSQIANDSTNSIASGASAFSNDHAHTEDDSHVTQMHHIAGRGITAKIIPRRLSRSHSASVIPTTSTEPNVIIGVSVQEATLASTPEDGVVTVSRRASVSASASLRHQSSRSSMARPKTANSSNWISKAKSFTQKFRRKTVSAATSFSS